MTVILYFQNQYYPKHFSQYIILKKYNPQTQMHCCCQLLWFVSIFALIFFTYIEIILASQPQFFPIKFSNKQQVINACIIVSMIYFVIFLLISALWWKQKYSHKKNEREQVEYIEMEQDKKSHDGAQ